MTLLFSSLLSALLLTLSFPKCALSFLAPLAFAPFFAALAMNRDRSLKSVFCCAYILGLVYHVACVYWISYVSFAGMLALSAFLALLFSLFMLGGYWLVKKGCGAFLTLPLAYLFFELLVSYLMTGFPWLLLSMTFARRTVFIQSADILGPHFLSFLLVLTSSALACAAAGKGKKAFLPLAAVALLWLMDASYGLYRIRELSKEEPKASATVSMIQLNLPPELKHDDKRDEQTMTDYLEATQKAAEGKDLIVWPETGVPGIYNDYGNTAILSLRKFRTEHKVPILCGLTWAEKVQGIIRFFNAAALLDNDAMLPEKRYYKKHLVIFGEYVPLEKYLPFLSLLTPIASSYSPGGRSHVVELKTRKGAVIKLGALICFEDVFPNSAREAAAEGAEILVNLTNDGWFMDSPGSYQHAALAVFRAVETRRELLRSSNTGITMLIDRLGREKACLTVDGKRVLVPGELTCEASAYPYRETVYTNFGDMGILLLGILLSALGFVFKSSGTVMVK